MDQKPIILKDGVLSELAGGETLSLDADHHSGVKRIASGKTLVVSEDRQMIVFGMLTLDGTLTLDGDLWLS